MSRQLGDQGGVATSDPPAIVRWISSKVVTRLATLAGLGHSFDIGPTQHRQGECEEYANP